MSTAECLDTQLLYAILTIHSMYEHSLPLIAIKILKSGHLCVVIKNNTFHHFAILVLFFLSVFDPYLIGNQDTSLSWIKATCFIVP